MSRLHMQKCRNWKSESAKEMLESTRVDSLNLPSTIKQRNFSVESDYNAKTNIFDFAYHNGKLKDDQIDHLSHTVASPLKSKFVEQIPFHVLFFSPHLILSFFVHQRIFIWGLQL